MHMFVDPKWKESLRIPDSHARALSTRLAEKRADILLKKKRADWVHHQYAPLYMPFEKTGIDTVSRLKETVGDPQFLILIGIGGSSLATEAVLTALGDTDRVMVFDTLVPEKMGDLEKRLNDHELNVEDIVVVVISKSGMTAETDANSTAVLSLLEAKYGDCRARVIAISDEGTPLESKARENGWRFCAIPKVVGGRYSAFTLASLIPLGLLGVHIDRFLLGAREALESVWKTPVLSDPSSVLASAQYLMHEKGIHREIDLYFSPQLETLGKWRRQLIAESTGKTVQGKRVGMLPEVAIGTTDLHSIEQYIADGPRDLFIFLHKVTPPPVPAPSVYKGKTIAELRDIILRGLMHAYQSEGVHHTLIDLGAIDEKSLGGYMALSMESTILFSHLLGVNPFDQPGVESYKTHTRALLGRGKSA
jgi:glucose-6-phosphate isomerase